MKKSVAETTNALQRGWVVGPIPKLTIRDAPFRRLTQDLPRFSRDVSDAGVNKFGCGYCGGDWIMSIAGHVSRAMLSRYSHVRMEAKRRALDQIAARQRAADEKRKSDTELAEPSAGAS